MATAAIRAIGTTISMYDSGDANPVVIVEVLSISGPDMENESIDVTNQDTTGRVREFIGGLVNPGTLTFDINLQPDIATHGNATNGLFKVFSDADTRQWDLTFSDTALTIYRFKAFIQNFVPEASVEDQLKASITLKLTSKPEFDPA